MSQDPAAYQGAIREVGPLGLQVVGAHCPEFDFGRRSQHVQEAVRRLEVSYPVVTYGEGILCWVVGEG